MYQPCMEWIPIKKKIINNSIFISRTSSFLKCHINLRFLPYFSSSLFDFTWSILFAVGKKRKISTEIFFLAYLIFVTTTIRLVKFYAFLFYLRINEQNPWKMWHNRSSLLGKFHIFWAPKNTFSCILSTYVVVIMTICFK